jgi:hypothetical protein
MPGTVKPQFIASQYKLTRKQIDELLTEGVKEALGLHGKKITLSYDLREVGGDPLDRFPGTKDVVGLTINVSDT